MRFGELLDALGDMVRPLTTITDALDHVVLRVIVPESFDDIGEGDLIMVPPHLEGSSATSILERFRRAGAVAAVLRARDVEAEDLRVILAASGLAVLELAADTSWQFALQRFSTLVEVPPDEEVDDFVGDLFALAEATALSVGGSVAIMNDYSRIVAYSSQPDQLIDDVRRDGILGRRVPAAMAATHSAVRAWPAGAVQVVESPGTLPRLVATVRASGKFLGSIWVIIATPHATDSMHRALAASARAAALHLMRYSSVQSWGSWRANQSFVQARLLGARTLGESTPTEVAVIAALPAGDLTAEEEILREQIASIVSLVVAPRRGGCALVDGVVYALLPVAAVSFEDLRGVADAIVERTKESLNQSVAVGISEVVQDATIGRVQSLEAARWQSVRGTGVAPFSEVRAQIVLDHAADSLRASGISLPVVDDILAHDRAHGTSYATTLRTYLENGQNVAGAAAALHMHGNSLRYRLRRMTVMFDVNLDDADTRLAVWMMLRLHRN
ncbi:PucR family transcriptional regulator [Zhihengliuella sp. ISTPL4]|uniref:PucR family transcriptional regulator n=1 Tax=Zhihengliuella sp. ISTPL4 TaxID=2058657 RepID=UPI000C7C4CE8|nr:helix-turn-helix domain-containing protein [Zhihengliuella sp. ISTPL4]